MKNGKGKTVPPSLIQHSRDVLCIALGRRHRWRLVAHSVAARTDPPRAERIETWRMHVVDGASATTQKSKLALSPADDGHYQGHQEPLPEAMLPLADADQRVVVTRERYGLRG